MILIRLYYNEIHKKQNFNALDIVKSESWVKRCGLFHM